MKARSVISGTTLGCAALVLGAMVPAHAGPATMTETYDDLWNIAADGTNEMAGFVNMTRTAYCTPEIVEFENDLVAWLAGDMVEPGPDYPGKMAIEQVTATLVAVGDGNFRSTFSTEVPVELWTFEGGKSWAAGNLVQPCVDTDGIVDGTAEVTAPGKLFAEGDGTVKGKDNDAYGTGPRTNIWGERLAASLSGPGGKYTHRMAQTNQGRPDGYIKGWWHFSLTER
jgi:hypothetical protein